MNNLPLSLTIAIRAVGSLWVVGLVMLIFGGPWEIVAASFGVGIAAGVVEWLAIRRKR